MREITEYDFRARKCLPHYFDYASIYSAIIKSIYDIIESMQDKISRFTAPKGFGICPVLFHLANVSDEIYNQRYFYRIIDITNFLEEESS